MDLKILKDTPPWDWPEGASATFLNVLRDTQAAEPNRLLAAELAAQRGHAEMWGDLYPQLMPIDEPRERIRCDAAVA